MRCWISGEKGFIATNLKKILQIGGHTVIEHNWSGPYRSYLWRYVDVNGKEKEEIDIYKNESKDIERFLTENKVEFIVHAAAIVGTDVCAQFSERTYEINVLATSKIAELAHKLNIPMIYIGTTVIYDTFEYQDKKIKEDSVIIPRTEYARTKYFGEVIVRATCENSGFAILRPLFCYGGIGDMNSLIAKTIYNHFYTKKKFKIFLDPTKIKSYMHVDDFAAQIMYTIQNFKKANGGAYNVGNNRSLVTSDIVKILEKNGVDTSYIEWRPETDYLGNHLIDSTQIERITKYSPEITMEEGIIRVHDQIQKMGQIDYNPLQYLQRIEKENIDIEKYYPRQ
jgi:nucleoside-diphosphate-sugar epimerase